jgi:hypothetical protein
MASSTVEVQTPRVVSVTFTSRGTRLTVELDDGRTISAPLAWYPRLQHGKARERNHWRLVGTGRGIHWPDLDEDISVDGLLSGKRSLESPTSLAQWLDGRSTKPKHE